MSVEHYENFPVASWLCPPTLRPAVRALYAYARTADDLADEGCLSCSERLAALDAYAADLQAVAAGQPASARWPEVFVPLSQVIARHDLPLQPLRDLLDAFRQDLTQTTYADRTELLDYCRRSADPIGRLLLHLYGVDDAADLHASDAICTALQLANFWQDLSVDTCRGRLYVPLADCVRLGVDADEMLSRRDSRAARTLIAEMVNWTRDLMRAGSPLVHRIGGRAGWELRLVVQGGLRILERIEWGGFDALLHRPRLEWHDAPVLAWRAFTMRPRLTMTLPEAAR